MIFKKSLARKISAVFFAAAVSVSRIFAVSSSKVDVSADTATLMAALFKDPSGISNVQVSMSPMGEELNASIGTFKDGKDLVGLDKGIVMGTGDVSKIFNSSSGSAVALLSFEGDAVETTAVANVTEVASPQSITENESSTAQNDNNSQGTPTLTLPATGAGYYYDYTVGLQFDIIPKSTNMDFQCVLASDAWDDVRCKDVISTHRGNTDVAVHLTTGYTSHLPQHNPSYISPGLTSIMYNAGYGNNDDPLATKDEFISTADEYAQELVSYNGRSTVLTQSVRNLTPGEVNHIEIALMATADYHGNTYFFVGYNDDDDLIYSQDEIQNKFSDGDDNTGVNGNGKGDNNTENSSDNDSDEDNKEPEKLQEPKPEPEQPEEPEIEKPELEEPTISEPEFEFDYEPELDTTVETVPEPKIYHPETSDNLNLSMAMIPVFSSAAGLILSKRKTPEN